MARKSRLAETKTQAWGEQGIYAGIYARLSVEDHDDFEQNSISNQQKIVQSFLAEHTEIEAIEFYADNGFTGMNFARPAFQQMLHDLRRGKIAGRCVQRENQLRHRERHFPPGTSFRPDGGICRENLSANGCQADLCKR